MTQARRSSSLTSVEPDVRELLVLCRRQPRIAVDLARKLWLSYLNNLLSEPLRWGQQDYGRLVVLGRYRSGSNLVRGSLLTHSRIVVFGDVFRRTRDPAFGFPFYRTSTHNHALFRRDPVAFLETRVFGRFPSRVQTVGLKLLYGKRSSDHWHSVRAALAGSSAVRAIHVKRENILRSHLSLSLKLRHGRWKDISGADDARQPVVLPYEECLNAFETTRAWEAEHDALFPPHRRLDVSYERLCADYEGESRRMQSFLGVEFEPIQPLTHKQTRSRLRDGIANYDELRERFQRTPWEQFFDDD